MTPNLYFDVILNKCNYLLMPIQQLKRPKATTFRLEPKLQEGLTMLSTILKKPLNSLVNEAVEDFLETRSSEAQANLEETLNRLRAYRQKDPKFEAAIAAFVDAEAKLGAEDPAEGRLKPTIGPVETLIHKLLNKDG
jgi:predicted transcriptional regulator